METHQRFLDFVVMDFGPEYYLVKFSIDEDKFGFNF